MTNLEFCRKQRKSEFPKFVAVLKAMPPGRLDYRPDPKARTAAELAWVLARRGGGPGEPARHRHGAVEGRGAAGAASRRSWRRTRRTPRAVNEKLERLDEAGWEKKGRFLMGEGPAWEDSIGEFVWGFLFDAIHHRGQLSTYLRPMGGKVPSIYGPSADDPGQ